MPVQFINPRTNTIQRGNRMLDATIRDFSGGWNVVDNDLNLDTKFSKVLQNMQRGIDGSNNVRPGTKLFAETEDHLDEIINCEYFSAHIIVVGRNGKLVAIDANGSVLLIWDDDRASKLKGEPNGWSTTTFASFAVFNGDLIVCNGINKPLIVKPNLDTEYLKDLGDDSNANTPIARFVVTHGRYLVMAGSLAPNEEDYLFISNTDTSGTWVGDSGPNDSVTLSLGSRVPSGSQAIKGLGRFRDKLVVAFEDCILPATLGAFTDDVHNPTLADAIENIGCISHRIMQTVSEDMFTGDINSISSIKRALFTGGITTERTSHLIDPAYHQALVRLNSTVTLEDEVWSVWDSANDNYMVFVPDAISAESTTEYRCFVYKKNKALKISAWHDWRNWKFRAGCRSSLKTVFLAEGTQIFRMGGTTDNIVNKDYEGDQEMWDDNVAWADYTGWNPVADTADSGIPIRFIWELPWSDHNARFDTKNSRYINFDTEGDNKFLVEMFTDNIYEDKNDFGEDWEEDILKFDDELGWDVQVLDPTLSMEFEGGDGPGFGADEYGEDFGGGRPTRLEKLYAWNSKYKLQKLRFSGDKIRDLKFISASIAYLGGSARR